MGQPRGSEGTLGSASGILDSVSACVRCLWPAMGGSNKLQLPLGLAASFLWGTQLPEARRDS